MGKFTTEYFIAASKFIVGFKDLLPEDKNAVLEVMSPEEISEEDLKNFDNLYIVEEGNPILKKMITVNKEEWDFVIGITVDKKTNTATDIIEAIEKISNRMWKF